MRAVICSVLFAVAGATLRPWRSGAAGAGCPGGTTLNIVAHEGDDLLFQNPDVQDDISAGRCVRTVFLTARRRRVQD